MAADPPSDLRRRPEQADDADFLLALFRETRGGMLAALEPAMQDMLLRHQLRGQAMTYRAQYPRAAFDIVELDGRAIGRIIEDRSAEAVTIVDVALLARWRGSGIGTRLLRDILDAADASGATTRLNVDADNARARLLYERLGFAVVARTAADLAMERPARN